jgi:hypothetical protein
VDITRLSVEGNVKVSVYDTSGHLVDQTANRNVITTAGINEIVQAVMWAGIEDQASNLGYTTPFFLTPLYGAVGTGLGSSTFILGETITSGDTYDAIVSTTSQSFATGGATLTLGAGTSTYQTITVPSAYSTSSPPFSIPVDSFQANATYAADSGVGVVTPADTELAAEVSRTTISGGGTYVVSNASQVVWSFFFGSSAIGWTATEVGVFAQASPAVGYGTLLNHAILAPITKSPANTAMLQVTLSLAVSL